MTAVILNFINNSDTVHGPQVVVFQKNTDEQGYFQLPVAWKVIESGSYGDVYPFTFSMRNYLAIGDDFGNFSPKQTVQNDQCWAFGGDPDIGLVMTGKAGDARTFEILNNKVSGAIHANVFKDGCLLASVPNIRPQNKVIFCFEPSIFIGVASETREGYAMNSAIAEKIDTKISLLGILSADIVMTGGTDSPYTFTLQNIMRAPPVLSDVKLNFINRSFDTNNANVVIFQRNGFTNYNFALAWKVITNCPRGWNHPFIYDAQIIVSVEDSFGNLADRVPATIGQRYSFDQDGRMSLSQLIYDIDCFEVKNCLPQGSVDAKVYRGSKLLDTICDITPGQRVAFEFRPVIQIGAFYYQVQEGGTLNHEMLNEVNTEFSLMGITSADIVMTGGGRGSEAKPFMFSIENITLADGSHEKAAKAGDVIEEKLTATADDGQLT